MTTLAAPTTTSAGRTVRDERLTFPRLVRSEWIKLTTLRSTWWSLGIAVVLAVGISMMIASASSEFGPGFPAVSAILMPTQFTMLVAGILGAISVTGEYSTGMIRSTVTAEPRRGAIVAAKAVVVSVLIGATTIVSYIVAILATAPLLTDAIDWSDAAFSTIPLALGVVSMICFALIGVGWGFLIRNGAGAIAATVGLLFVLPIVATMFTLAGEAWSWIVDASAYLPTNVSSTIMAPGATDMLPEALALLGWVVALLLGGWAVLRTRDA